VPRGARSITSNRTSPGIPDRALSDQEDNPLSGRVLALRATSVSQVMGNLKSSSTYGTMVNAKNLLLPLPSTAPALA
jgi:hypothetical protein